MHHQLVERHGLGRELEAAVLVGHFGQQIRIRRCPNRPSLHAHLAQTRPCVRQHLLIGFKRLLGRPHMPAVVVERNVLPHALQPKPADGQLFGFLGKGFVLFANDLRAEDERFLVRVGQDGVVGEVHHVVALGVAAGVRVRLDEIRRQRERRPQFRRFLRQRGQVAVLANTAFYRQRVRPVPVAALRPALQGILDLLHASFRENIDDFPPLRQGGHGALGVKQQPFFRRGEEEVNRDALLAHVGGQAALH